MKFRRCLLTDDRGQDLLEYVLLGATVAFASLILANVMPGVISAAYASWDAATQALWNPQPPAS